MVAKSFKFMVLRLLAKTFVNQKVESVHFYSCPQAKLSPRFSSLLSPGRRKLLIPPKQRFLKIFFPPDEKKAGRIIEPKKWKRYEIQITFISGKEWHGNYSPRKRNNKNWLENWFISNLRQIYGSWVPFCCFASKTKLINLFSFLWKILLSYNIKVLFS